jgi:hypothetical protein
MAQTVLLQSRPKLRPTTGGTDHWSIANLNSGLCVPTSTATSEDYDSLADCQRYARPLHRELRWNVVNSSGYGPQGQLVSECRPTLDPSGQFADGKTCASSVVAQFSAYPQPDRRTGWICTNPALGECIQTQNVGVPFSYTVYPSHAECVQAPENNQDSSIAMGALPAVDPSQLPRWYIDATANRCGASYLSAAPFDTVQQCQTALHQCNTLGQPTLQFSNPLQAQDDRRYT